MLGAMPDGLVLTRRMSERGVRDTAQRAGSTSGGDLVRHYVGYEESPGPGVLRREMARLGVALIRNFVSFAGLTPGAYAAQAGLVPEVRFVQDAEPPRPAQ